MSPDDQSDHIENPYASPQFPVLTSDEHDSEDADLRQLWAFVGRNAQYYVNKWTPLLRGQSDSAGFNWAAFFLSGFWLPYRKMYKITCIFYAIIVLETIFEDVLFVRVLGKPEPPDALARIIGFAAAIICGAFGNRWYLSHARGVISQLTAEGFRDDALSQILSRRGGTSLAASLGMFVLFLAVLVVTVLFLVFLLHGDGS